MTTLIYHNRVIYSDSHISSERLTEGKILEMQRERDNALANGKEVIGTLLDLQLKNPYLGENGDSAFAKQHGKFYWLKTPQFVGNKQIKCVGLYGNMMAYSACQLLDKLMDGSQFDFGRELAQINYHWYMEAGTEASFGFFFVVEGGIVIQWNDGEFYMMKDRDDLLYVFGSGRDVLYQEQLGARNVKFFDKSIQPEQYFSASGNLNDIMTFIQNHDEETNDHWVSFRV